MPVVALPDSLSRAVAAEGNRLPADELIHAAQRLSLAYRREAGGVPMRLGEAERAAYTAMRLPATYAAVRLALDEMSRTIDVACIERCLDAGAGPGTASLAARACLPHLSVFSQIERDAGWSDSATRLSAAMGLVASRVIGDIATLSTRPHDLVVAAYVLNEVPQSSLDATVRMLWSAASIALVVVEPGTPQGFAVVHRVRELCLQLDGHAAAPCTHDASCPMTSSDWCHRAVRVERGALHRKLKAAQLGFEDEKFCYVVMTRPEPMRIAASRIVRRPIRAGGHVHLDLCSQTGLARTTVTRADRPAYRAARDADWGETWPPMMPDDGEGG